MTIQELYKSYLELKEVTVEELKKYVTDKSIPLNERWDLFIKSELGDDEQWQLNLKCISSDDLYINKVHIDSNKGEYFTINDTYLCLQDRVDGGEFEKEILDVFKEEVLELFIKSHVFDW